MTDAREWLASVTEAARTVAALAAYEEAVRSRAAISPLYEGTRSFMIISIAWIASGSV